MGLFDRVKGALTKTRRWLTLDIRDVFKGGEHIEEVLDPLTEVLIKTDMGVEAAGQIVDRVATEFRGRKVVTSEVIATIKDELRKLLEQSEAPIRYAESGPTVIMVAGVNGCGKTTSIAKLTHRYTSEGKKVVLGAGDTFRAAAVEQLGVWAERTGATLVKGEPGGNAPSVGFQAVERALAENADICIVDTAGRLHTNQNLMRELEKIHRVLGKQIPEAPHEVLLVLDATSGQTAIRQAENFTEYVSCTGIVLAKLDGTAKGGVVVPIREKFGLPVKFVGLGEGADDLTEFRADDYVNALFEGFDDE